MEKTYRSQIRPLQMEMTVLLPVLPSAEKELAIILDFEKIVAETHRKQPYR